MLLFSVYDPVGLLPSCKNGRNPTYSGQKSLLNTVSLALYSTHTLKRWASVSSLDSLLTSITFTSLSEIHFDTSLSPVVTLNTTHSYFRAGAFIPSDFLLPYTATGLLDFLTPIVCHPAWDIELSSVWFRCCGCLVVIGAIVDLDWVPDSWTGGEAGGTTCCTWCPSFGSGAGFDAVPYFMRLL